MYAITHARILFEKIMKLTTQECEIFSYSEIYFLTY
jgi:hypothetical protein